MPHALRSRAGWAAGLTAAAFAWAVALIAGAALVPVYVSETGGSSGPVTRSTSTLLETEGAGVLVLMAVPAILVALAWLGLRRRCSGRERAAGGLAWTAIALLFGFALVGSASIGLFVLPAVVLLAGAAVLTPARRA